MTVQHQRSLAGSPSPAHWLALRTECFRSKLGSQSGSTWGLSQVICKNFTSQEATFKLSNPHSLASWQPRAPHGRGAIPGRAASHRPLMCLLLVAERPAPPRELLVPQAEVSARGLRLQWVPGSDGASPIRYFTVQVRELPGGEWQTYSSSISHEATACAVERYQAGQEGPALVIRDPPPTCSCPQSTESAWPKEMHL